MFILMKKSRTPTTLVRSEYVKKMTFVKTFSQGFIIIKRNLWSFIPTN